MRDVEADRLCFWTFSLGKRTHSRHRPPKDILQRPRKFIDLISRVTRVVRMVAFRLIADELFLGNGLRDRVVSRAFRPFDVQHYVDSLTDFDNAVLTVGGAFRNNVNGHTLPCCIEDLVSVQ